MIVGELVLPEVMPGMIEASRTQPPIVAAMGVVAEAWRGEMR
jgi:hypothetical protein